jgi:hypothetical protein
MSEQHMLKFTVSLFLIALMGAVVAANPAWDWVTDNITLFQEARYDGDYQIFALHKNREFKKVYNTEANMNVDLAFLGIKQRFYWMFRGELRAGLSQSRMNVVLSPYNMSYVVLPSFEYRFKQVYLSAGLDHRCHHYIDQQPPKPIVYWNKVVVSLNSPHRRSSPNAEVYIGDDSWNGWGRFIWSFTWGYYISEFFGLIEPYKLMSIERPHYVHDFQLSSRYGIVRWNWGAVLLSGTSMVGMRHSGDGPYWSQETGIETLFKMRTYDTSVFVNYILDGGVFNSKDRLLAIGVRVVK